MSEWIKRIIAAWRDIPRELREGSRANARLAEFVEYHRTLNEECKDPN